MRKTFQLHVEGKHPERVLDAVKHDIRKYIKRERRRDVPEGAQFWDFDCRFGLSQGVAQAVHVSQLTECINAVVAQGEPQFYVEILAKPGHRAPRSPESDAQAVEADDELI